MRLSLVTINVDAFIPSSHMRLKPAHWRFHTMSHIIVLSLSVTSSSHFCFPLPDRIDICIPKRRAHLRMPENISRLTERRHFTHRQYMLDNMLSIFSDQPFVRVWECDIACKQTRIHINDETYFVVCLCQLYTHRLWVYTTIYPPENI